MSNLDELFSGFDNRKRAELQAVKSEMEEQARRAARTSQVLATLVLPVLEEYAEQIREQKHAVEIKERLQGETPSLTLDFAPMVKHPYMPNSAAEQAPFSYLVFAEVENTIKAERSVNNFRDRNAAYTAKTKWAIDELNEKAVRELVLSFVKAVLDAN